MVLQHFSLLLRTKVEHTFRHIIVALSRRVAEGIRVNLWGVRTDTSHTELSAAMRHCLPIVGVYLARDVGGVTSIPLAAKGCPSADRKSVV